MIYFIFHLEILLPLNHESYESVKAYINRTFISHLDDHQVAEGLKGGCDFNCEAFYVKKLPSALASGIVAPSDVDQAISRMLKKMFQLGLFDPVEVENQKTCHYYSGLVL